MCITRLGTWVLVIGAVAALASFTHASTIIVDDDFADGDRAKTGTLDSNWWTSSSSSGDEISVGSLGLVTGSSGRGLHTVFPTQTLANVGDKLTATFAFTTPNTVGVDKGAGFRIGLFDTLGRTGLNADVSASSGSPNDLYGWNVGTGNTGEPGIPGYMMDLDVGGSDEDINFRRHNTGSATGRLMGTTGTGSFSSISPSGPDGEYSFSANSAYTGSFSIARTSSTEVELTGTLEGPSVSTSYSLTDAFESIDLGFLGFHVNGSTFGSSSSAGQPDNGIDFSRITIEFSSVPEPSTGALLLSLPVLLAGGARRDRA